MSSHPRKQILADLGEAYKRTALVRIKPARGDREIKPGLVFGRRGLQLKQHRTIDQLDMNAPVLDRLDGMGELKQLAGCGLGVGVRTRLHELIQVMFSAAMSI
jgi:hypothetical protein